MAHVIARVEANGDFSPPNFHETEDPLTFDINAERGAFFVREPSIIGSPDLTPRYGGQKTHHAAWMASGRLCRHFSPFFIGAIYRKIPGRY